MELDLPAARALAIAAQRLDRRPDHPAAKADVLATIRHLGVIQIDTINVVARAPYFVLWSRLGEYDPRWFDELLYPDGLLFEYWAHAASFLPIELWPLFRHAMLNQAAERPRLATWRRDNAAVVEQVLGEIRRRGPLRAADFDAPPEHAGGGWWNWKPAKEALDISWLFGELMIQRRINFQRVYELTERLLPQRDDAAPSPAEARRQQAEIALRALGLATERQLRDYYRMRADETAAALKLLLADGRAIETRVAGWDEPAYAHADHRGWLENGPPPAGLTTLLSPFDSLVWDRERNLALWGFEYKIECYTPAAKRRYGYFTLPILWRDALVGRVDAKAERKAGVFRVKALHLEPGVPLSDELLADLAWALRDCAAWHRTPQVVIDMADPPELRAALAPLLAD